MLGTIDIKGAYKIEILVNLITYQFYLTKFQVIPEFHMISHHKSVAKTCYVVARDMLFFCFSHRSRTVFLGMPIRVCLHLSKIIFKAQWGWRYWRWPCWRIIYCCKKRLKKITRLFLFTGTPECQKSWCRQNPLPPQPWLQCG